MNGLMESVLRLREEANIVGGEIKSITVDEKARDEMSEYDQYCAPNVCGNNPKKLFGILIEKE